MVVLFFQVAYVLLWTFLLGYVFYLGQRQHRLEQELGRLREELGGR